MMAMPEKILRMAPPRVRPWVLLAALVIPDAIAEPLTYRVDPTHTFPMFEISHLGFSKHRGRFNATQGTVTLNLEKKQGQIEIKIDAASIDTGHEALEKILRSDGFFDVAQFPDIHFRADRFEFLDQRLQSLHGQLTMKGVTRPITLNVDHFHCGRPLFQPKPVCGANATTSLLRSDFGLDKYVNFGLGDEVRITIQIEAIAETEMPSVAP